MKKYQAIDLKTGEKLQPNETFTLRLEKDGVLYDSVALEALKVYRDLTEDVNLKADLSQWIDRLLNN